jgi:hypothetical protein
MTLLLLAGCMTMDSFFFNGVAVTAYGLNTDVIPADALEEVDFPSTDDLTLYGVWAHQEDPDAQVLIYFHGNDANIDAYISQFEIYWSMGYETFIFDYRGYGKSGGSPSFQGILDDGVAAIDYASEETGRSPEALAYLGLSLGGAVAVHDASSRPPQVLITEDLFASGQKIMDDGSGLDMPQGWMLADEWDNVAAAADVHVPYFVMHGADDTFIMSSSANELYDAANDPKKLWLVPGADHAQDPVVDPDGYRENVSCWIAQTCPEE